MAENVRLLALNLVPSILISRLCVYTRCNARADKHLPPPPTIHRQALDTFAAANF